MRRYFKVANDYSGKSFSLNTLMPIKYNTAPITAIAINCGINVPPPVIADGSNNVFIERKRRFSRSLLVPAIISRIRNAIGIPAPRASEFLVRLNTQENKKDIPPIAKRSKAIPMFRFI